MAGVDAEFSRHLTSIFDAAGWRTNFNNVAVEKYHPTHRVTGTVVSGFNPMIVEAVATSLKEYGIANLRSSLETSEIKQGSPKWPHVQGRVNIMIGYKESAYSS